MNLKKTYVEKYGYERVTTDRNSPLAYAELDFLKLANGQSYTIDERGKEFALSFSTENARLKAKTSVLKARAAEITCSKRPAKRYTWEKTRRLR